MERNFYYRIKPLTFKYVHYVFQQPGQPVFLDKGRNDKQNPALLPTLAPDDEDRKRQTYHSSQHQGPQRNR